MDHVRETDDQREQHPNGQPGEHVFQRLEGCGDDAAEHRVDHRDIRPEGRFENLVDERPDAHQDVRPPESSLEPQDDPRDDSHDTPLDDFFNNRLEHNGVDRARVDVRFEKNGAAGEVLRSGLKDGLHADLNDDINEHLNENLHDDRLASASSPLAGVGSSPVTVDIYDQAYHLRGQDPAYITQLALIVDGKMRAVAAGGTTVDSLRVAVLAALNIADQLVRVEAQYRALSGSVSASEDTLRHRAENLSGLLDDILSDDRKIS